MKYDAKTEGHVDHISRWQNPLHIPNGYLMKNLLATWPTCLHQRIVEDRMPAYLTLDTHGVLKNWEGHIEQYGLIDLQKEQSASSQIACLHGLLPLHHSPTVLEGIETPSGRPADIHLVQKNKKIYVLFLDASKWVTWQKQAQQSSNELRLLYEQHGQSWVGNLIQEAYTTHVDLAALFKALDVLILVYNTNNTFTQKGTLPTWCPILFPQAIQHHNNLKPQTTFPILEYFIDEAKQHWAQNKKTRLRSGIWYETLPDGSTCLMEATALRVDDETILLIEKLDGLGDERQHLLQQGRNQQLLFQQEIAHHKKLANQFKQAKESAETVIQEKSDLLANMSHELRTPLTSILGFSEILEDQLSGPVNEKHIQYLHNIVSSGEYLLRLINSILDLARLEAGRQQVYQDTVDLNHMLRDITQTFEPQLWDRPITFQTIIPNTLDTIETDIDKLRQILINLVGNAVKFTQEGQITICVIAQQTTPLSIEIIDTGPGIPDDEHKRIFEAFQQVGKRKREGTGLGLAITKALCEVLGFQLTVTSKIDHGTKFSIILQPHTQNEA